jgi:spore maturation protein CgeB
VKIAILGRATPGSLESEISSALRHLGHSTVVGYPGSLPAVARIPRRTAAIIERLLCGFDLLRSGHEYARLEAPLLRWLRRENAHVLIVVNLPLLSPQVASRLKQSLGIRLLGWYPDAIVNLSQHDFLLAPYDLIYLKDPFMVRAFGAFFGDSRVRYLPEGFDETSPLSEPSDEELGQYRCDVMLWGNCYPYRVRLLEALGDFGIRLYGPAPGARQWLMLRVPHTGVDVRGREKLLACRGAAICLNPCHFAEIEGGNQRLWDLAGLGGFQLTNVPAASRYFDPENEVAIFSDVSDLKDKLRFYLQEPERRRRMARAAQRKTLANHTWTHRARVVLDDLADLEGA